MKEQLREMMRNNEEFRKLVAMAYHEFLTYQDKLELADDRPYVLPKGTAMKELMEELFGIYHDEEDYELWSFIPGVYYGRNELDFKIEFVWVEPGKMIKDGEPCHWNGKSKIDGKFPTQVNGKIYRLDYINQPIPE